MGNQIRDRVSGEVVKWIAGAAGAVFLVEVKVSPGKIIVLIDKPQGITITECSALARHLQEVFSDTDIFEKHELEVSSPGIEEPLKVPEQYRKETGRQVRVLMTGGTVKKGILKQSDAEGVTLEERTERKINKKKVVDINNIYISLKDIKETTIVFKI
jgi:ribosome maturation factor RimP